MARKMNLNNNSGKTFMMQLLYGVLNEFSDSRIIIMTKAAVRRGGSLLCGCNIEKTEELCYNI